MATTETKNWDWRVDYVICEHVATDEKAGTRHFGFRVCCEICFDAGFLLAEPLNITERADGLAVGLIAKAEGH